MVQNALGGSKFQKMNRPYVLSARGHTVSLCPYRHIKGLGNRDISKSFLFFAAATPLRAQKRRRQAADFLSIYLDIGVKTILFRAILKRRGFLYSAGSITPLFSRTSENESYIQETQHLKPRRSVYESGASSTVSLVRSNAKRAPRRPPASFVRSSGSIMLLATATVKPR